MKSRSVVLSVALGVCLMAATVFAHEFIGTVISADPSSITISVIDESTKKATPMTFDLTKDTKIQRGAKVVSFADAHIQKGDKASVTVDHEMDMKVAIVLKLDVKK